MEEVSNNGDCVEENAMDTCSQEQMDAAQQSDGCANYKTDEDAAYNVSKEKSTKGCILKMLDEMDRRVEKLRADASRVEAERDEILTSLDTLNNSQLVHSLDGIDLDEITRYIMNLAQRSTAVKVEISSERSGFQQESLHLVNTMIDSLIKLAKSDVTMARKRCMSYLNSCSDSSEAMLEGSYGIDTAFERAVLGCTLEDQKRIKKRLNGLHSYFSTFSPALTEIREEDENLDQIAGPSSTLS